MLEEEVLHPYTSVVIVAAGNSTRMSEGDKIIITLSDKPLIYHTIKAFENAGTVDEIIIVTREDLIKKIFVIVNHFKLEKVKKIICGGQSREQSVVLGFNSISPNCKFISIHDGARPLIKSSEIDFIHRECYIYKAVCSVMKIKDTIKKIDLNGKIISTLDRNFLAAAATPQVFERNIYDAAIKNAGDKLMSYTDDASLVEDAGYAVKTFFCGYQNIKITTDEDLLFAQALLNSYKLNLEV